MTNSWLTEAVANNAAWCDAIAASHGVATVWTDSIWMSIHPLPHFYPNIVTLRSGTPIDEAIEAIEAIGKSLPVGWGIKDSFNELDLGRNGFTVAFEAHWYCRLPNQRLTTEESGGTRIQIVQTAFDLSRWIRAWGEGNGIFSVSLLDNSAVELVYVERNGEVVSGLATNQSGDSVGISNTFGSTEDLLRCVAAVVNRHPNKGIVGYDSKADIAALLRIGFYELGDLRVWLRT